MVNSFITAVSLSFLAGALIPLPAVAAPKKNVAQPAKPVIAEPAKQGEVQGFTDPTTGMEFVLIKGGCFQMGDAFGDGERNEKPVHEVCVSDFAMGKYEVTNAQFRLFRPSHSSGNYEGRDLNGDNQPVANVSYLEDAVAYAQWLSGKSGKNYRLPTEAEWEYAARGGTATRNYWGSSISNPCNYANAHDMSSKRAFKITLKKQTCDDGYAVSAPVGSFRPNAYGLYDMMGNVWEWASDWYDETYYGKSPRDNPQGPSSGWARVIRGGSWSNAPWDIRASKRNYLQPGHRFYIQGFRLVAPVPQAK